ncbi:flagellar protein FlaG [Pseudomonas sp. ABC1]|uniref:flagellar protein FlaG n=1 Tax=Pseudomonas sp. ABC1 TaxID=2748080 RepID=UPI0015C3BFAA|nr:flagellar protein FlaG [Pseudomonas sp. ABC1]QLF92469.1 flagellar protein FlaG [Pseudomonas sp. ABC1]
MDIALSNRLPGNTPAPQAVQDGLRGTAARQADSGTVAGVEKASVAQEKPARVESVEEAVSSIKDFVQTIRRDLNFDLDDSSGKMVVKVTDRASGEIIRQIPSEEALRLAENLEEARSLLFKAKA